MPDVEPTSFHPPAFAQASAYTPSQAAELGVPRGLVPFGARDPAPSDSSRDDAATPETTFAHSPAEITPEPEATPLPGPTQGLGPRTRFRFQAHDAESPVIPPTNLTRDPATARRAGAVRKVPKVSTVTRWLSLGAVAVAAGTAGFFFALPPAAMPEDGDASAKPIADGRLWTPGDQRKLEAILSAERRAQPREMNELLTGLRATHPHLAGLQVLEARAAATSHSYAEANAALARASQAPLADPVTLRLEGAAINGYQRNLDAMRTCLGEAIALDPTRAEFHFQRAEVDRRQGRTEESLAGFNRALALAKSGFVPSRETIEFRRRLLLIERGRESEIDTRAYHAAFAQPAPPADWLLTAAALSLQRNDPATAASWLRAARAAMPWTNYVERLDDYFFRNHADEPGMKELFPTGAERDQFHATLPPTLSDP